MAMPSLFQRSLLPLLLVVAAAFVAMPAQASISVQYFERTAATDKEADFDAGNGALDIIAVHVSERYSYDSGNRTGNETLQFRIELRQRDAIRQMPPENNGPNGIELTPIEYTLGFSAGGKDRTFTARLTQFCTLAAPPQGSGLDCREPKMTAPNFSTKDGGVTFVINRAKEGLPVGTAISKVWAASATVTQGQATYQDVAPKDNANQPEATEPQPPANDKSLVLEGTFPFLTMTLLSSAQQYAVPGGPASFVLQFRTHDKLNGIDHVFLDFKAGPGWTFDGNLGTDFVTTAGGQVIEYEFIAKAPAFASPGQDVPIIVNASTQSSGGHASLPVSVRVSGAKVDAADYVFTLETPGPFKAESASVFRWKIERDGAPLEHYKVAADFILNKKAVDSPVGAEEKEPGVYEASFTFPSGGSWTVDPFIIELQPSPHHEFPVDVQSAKGGLLPGFGLLGAWVALGYGALRRRL